MSTRIQ